MFDKLKEFWGYFLQIFLPNACFGCGVLEDNLVCTSCLMTVTPICKFRVFHPYISESVSVFAYEGVLKLLIWAYKHQGFEPLAATMGKKLLDTYPYCPFLGVDVWISTPLHTNRLKTREFDHVVGLFGMVLANWGETLSVDLVTRIVDTPMLFTLDKYDRRICLEGAFALDLTFDWNGKKVGIVDDILTSGATVSEIAKLLKSAGAESVVVLALAGGDI